MLEAIRGRDEAVPQQPALQQVHQPLSIRKIGLAARDVRDMTGVAHQHLLEVPVLDQRIRTVWVSYVAA
jgi:hypothetical protein